jgi:hypothetical protein
MVSENDTLINDIYKCITLLYLDFRENYYELRIHSYKINTGATLERNDA